MSGNHFRKTASRTRTAPLLRRPSRPNPSRSSSDPKHFNSKKNGIPKEDPEEKKRRRAMKLMEAVKWAIGQYRSGRLQGKGNGDPQKFDDEVPLGGQGSSPEKNKYDGIFAFFRNRKLPYLDVFEEVVDYILKELKDDGDKLAELGERLKNNPGWLAIAYYAMVDAIGLSKQTCGTNPASSTPNVEDLYQEAFVLGVDLQGAGTAV